MLAFCFSDLVQAIACCALHHWKASIVSDRAFTSNRFQADAPAVCCQSPECMGRGVQEGFPKEDTWVSCDGGHHGFFMYQCFANVMQVRGCSPLIWCYGLNRFRSLKSVDSVSSEDIKMYRHSELRRGVEPAETGGILSDRARLTLWAFRVVCYTFKTAASGTGASPSIHSPKGSCAEVALSLNSAMCFTGGSGAAQWRVLDHRR